MNATDPICSREEAATLLKGLKQAYYKLNETERVIVRLALLYKEVTVDNAQS